ncbi:MAG TPA: hypothetical protein VGR53_11535 [Nitrososphaerales archaeon]|nr:hypothetical protein [Nitrososphaerales archaeon]
MFGRNANGSWTAVVLLAVMILVGGAFVLTSFHSYQTAKKAAILSVSVPIQNPTAGEVNHLDFGILDSGGDANNVVLNLNSPAFGAVNMPSVTILQGQSIDVSSDVSFKDVQNGVYVVSTNINYHDVNGSHSVVGPQFTWYVLPKVQVPGFGWYSDLFHPLGKSSIGRNDSTTIHFEVHSLSSGQNVLYTHLSASVLFTPAVTGMSISPSSQIVSDLAPGGTSGTYTFSIHSSNAAPGHYTFVIYVLADGNVATWYTGALDVTQ